MNRLPILILYCLLPVAVLGADAPDPLFDSADMLDLTLTAPFDLIDDERDKEKEYEGSLSYLDATGAEVVLDAQFSVRGNWRLDKRNCRYSQLWINLRRGQVQGTLFENQNRLKLVVQCNRANRYADYIIKELQAYQLFSELSEIHFDTRLVNVSYADSERPNNSRNHIAFFIEHQNRLADRFGFSEVELNTIPREELNKQQSKLMSLFMYLLGNTDYSMIQGPEDEECCHNAKLLQNPAGEYIPVPYDFDASGFVDTTYAPEPNPAFSLRNNRQRLYRGFCVSEEELNGAIAEFMESREQMTAIVADTTYVSSRSANRTLGYMEDFFEILEDPRRIEREFVDDCR
ncbi:MAG: hypothetical protein QGG67_13930 [Gammaproteobacteria bacterium]|jgi:hypothetical protein|nr:hypothetical protein [Gammaproteobacteria bacterium]MDP6097061.1 hypothetical protein [Gammaproteobacteria bacterium]HJO12540.1 hypothetical protein [Gammaproteobacteria bacterium]